MSEVATPAPPRARPRIALMLRNLGYAYQDSLLEGIHEASQALGFDVFCLVGGVLSSAEDPRNTAYSVVGPRDVDGVIMGTGSLGGDESSPAVQDLLARFSSMPSCSISYAQPGMPSICVDNSSGTYAATRHLIEKHQRRRLAFLTGPGEESKQRLAGFLRAHTDCGIRFDESLLFEGNYSADSGVAVVAHLGTPTTPKVDALVAANDWMAMGVIDEAERRGFSIPEQIALVGFDDSDQARFTTPPLTTVRQPIVELGREAVRLVAAQIAGQSVPSLTHLATEVVLRQSCGCVRRAVSPERSIARANGGLLDSLTHSRELCEQALFESMPNQELLGPNWAVELVDALLLDIEGQNNLFIALLDKMLQRTVSLGSLTSWHGAVSSMRGAAIRCGVTDAHEWFRFESLVEAAHILIGSHTERVQGRRRVAKEIQMHAVEALGNTVRMALDYDALSQGLSSHLGSLGIRNCWLTLIDEQTHSEAPSRLIVAASDQGSRAVHGLPEFPVGSILPAFELMPRPTTYVLQPMAFGGETLGFCVMPHGQIDTAIYYQVCAPVTAAIKAVLLLKTVVTEVQRREALERERLEHEMAIAQRIQTAIFPKDLRVRGLEISASMSPATEVGGDYFDVLPTTDGCWLGIGDVAGHGLPTGMVALMIQSIVAATTQHSAEAGPAELWLDVNSVLCDNIRTRLGQNEHATLTLIRYWSDGRLLYAGAHEDMVVLRVNSEHSEVVPTIGVWAGITKELSPEAKTQRELQLGPGDLLLLYSDGVTEAMDAQNRMFGLQRVRRIFEEHRHESAEGIRLAILAELGEWTRAQEDDRTVVVLRYRG